MANKKIMIVDDDKEFLGELVETLLLSGYETVALDDASSVVESAARIKPAAILLDLKMPDKSGFQVAHELKQSAMTAHIPVLAMSAFFKDDYAPLLDICGIKRCFKKPFNPLEVIAELEAVVN
jgi:DNA-binding response OmpR family regulator